MDGLSLEACSHIVEDCPGINTAEFDNNCARTQLPISVCLGTEAMGAVSPPSLSLSLSPSLSPYLYLYLSFEFNKNWLVD